MPDPAEEKTAAAISPAEAADVREAAAPSSPGAPPEAPPDRPEPDWLSFLQGTSVVGRSDEHGYMWAADLLLDDNPTTGWAVGRAQVAGAWVILELPRTVAFHSFSFDVLSTEGVAATVSHVRLSASQTGPDEGYAQILEAEIEAGRDGQVFKLPQEASGRWIRIDAVNKRPDARWLELMGIHGFGRVIGEEAASPMAGTWQGSLGTLRLREEGGRVFGCYDRRENGLIDMTRETPAAVGLWSDGPVQERSEGTVAFVVTGSGQRLRGFYWEKSGGPGIGRPNFWSAEKVADDKKPCPGWKKDAPDPLVEKLEKEKRVILYGILFDFDKDVIKAQSIPTLEHVSSILRERPEWKITIEGHTDNVGGDAYNQGLSQRRAEAVAGWLRGATIAGERLQSVGSGASRPVSSNNDPVGRAQNRRVEIVRD